ncbi:MAG: guanylate kinase [Rhodospirillaceae bacterium]|nr:guanylate kinase [Rhodospirillaceae bacterium]
MLVLSSPSGAGKSSIAAALLKSDPNVVLSVSATTRSPRPGESEGVHYYFVDVSRFEKMKADGAFLESAKVFDNYYGTPRDHVETKLRDAKDVLFDIDWQGTRQLRENARDDLVSIFILPPSMQELERRLRGRGQDNEDVVQKRMARAADEMSHWSEYDYVLVNRDIEKTIAQVQNILAAERMKRARLIGLGDFVKNI